MHSTEVLKNLVTNNDETLRAKTASKPIITDMSNKNNLPTEIINPYANKRSQTSLLSSSVKQKPELPYAKYNNCIPYDQEPQTNSQETPKITNKKIFIKHLRGEIASNHCQRRQSH